MLSCCTHVAACCRMLPHVAACCCMLPHVVACCCVLMCLDAYSCLLCNGCIIIKEVVAKFNIFLYKYCNASHEAMSPLIGCLRIRLLRPQDRSPQGGWVVRIGVLTLGGAHRPGWASAQESSGRVGSQDRSPEG